ncbi:MAG: biopolymer transporter ExbD [Verrucomicrobia bacterium]|nr:biopolymer transporter ExbD [Verrucomicrobiota bacterium]
MNFYQRKRRMPAVIIVSLIDIFAILLIFVIVTSTFKRPQPAVTIKLPESTTAAPHPQAEHLAELSISPEGTVRLDGVQVAADELSSKIKAVVEANRSLALKADTQAPFGVIVRVLDSLKEAGVTGNLPAFTETKGK